MKSQTFKKVLFLDIDGVLNYGNWFQIWQARTHKHYKFWQPADPEKIKLLSYIKKKTKCKIVMISSWRSSWNELTSKKGVKEYGRVKNESLTLRKLFNKYNIHFTDYWSLCPYYGYGNRSEEILDFVDEHNVKRWVTLDDMEYRDPGLIHIDGTIGLTKEQADEAIRRLNGTN